MSKARSESSRRARAFVEQEEQFQLGFLVTEQSHPVTRELSVATRRDVAEGVRLLLEVDLDIARRAEEFLASDAVRALVAAVERVIREHRRIVFSGCGATGRLAVLLESMCRRCFGEEMEVRGIITGGDRALIRSVESFEDVQEFGQEQVRELELTAGDLLVAISEGGETSSVIGTAWEAAEQGCEVFFVYNNPTSLLVERIERSRMLIRDRRITTVDLCTGPMALSGSTRLQATTAELFVVGAALEEAYERTREMDGVRFDTGESASKPSRRAAEFATLCRSLGGERNRNALAELVKTESEVYRRGEMVLYATDVFLLDIFGDTTERTPTFSIPPFKRMHDPPDQPRPWAVAYHPDLETTSTWRSMLGRNPVGLSWESAIYERLGASRFAASPPHLDENEIMSYPVGKEVPEFYAGRIGLNLKVDVTTGESHTLIRIADDSRGFATTLELSAPDSPMHLFAHIGVKLVFNTLSTATMALLGRIQGNWMTHVSPTNKKLIDRSIRIVADLLSLDYRQAAELVFDELATPDRDRASLVHDIVVRG